MEKLFRFKKDQFEESDKDATEQNLSAQDRAELEKLTNELRQKSIQLKQSLKNVRTQIGSLEQALDGLDFNIKMCDVYLPIIFPDQPVVDQMVKDVDQFTYSQLLAKNTYNPQYLLFHTRDKAWLVEYAARMIARYNPKQKIDMALLQDYVKTAPAFEKRCRAFEDSVIAAYIHQTMHDIHEYEFMPPKPLHPAYHGEYDEYLRSSVITSARLLGLDRHTAEVGLEKNANLWRKQMMQDTFDTKYYPDAKYPLNSKDRTEWDKLHEQHFDVWLKQREYHYYQNNKAILDELNLKTDFMQMTPSQVVQLNAIVDGYENIRQVFFQDVAQRQAQHKQNSAQNQTRNGIAEQLDTRIL